MADRKNSEAIVDIEALAVPTLDEYARQRFCSMLRRHAIQDLPGLLEKKFTEHARPNAVAKGVPVASWRDIESIMKNQDIYQFYSSIRYNVQEMCFQSVQMQVERALPDMIETAKVAAQRNYAGGSLRLESEH